MCRSKEVSAVLFHLDFGTERFCRFCITGSVVVYLSVRESLLFFLKLSCEYVLRRFLFSFGIFPSFPVRGAVCYAGNDGYAGLIIQLLKSVCHSSLLGTCLRPTTQNHVVIPFTIYIGRFQVYITCFWEKITRFLKVLCGNEGVLNTGYRR